MEWLFGDRTSEAVLPGSPPDEGRDPHLAGSLKRDKIQKNCGARHAKSQAQTGKGQGSDKSLEHRKGDYSLFSEGLLNRSSYRVSPPTT